MTLLVTFPVTIFCCATLVMATNTIIIVSNRFINFVLFNEKRFVRILFYKSCLLNIAGMRHGVMR